MAFGLTERQQHRFKTWFFEGLREPEGPHARHPHQSAWWKVMCLTGVDYFSTLGYQPGIAFLAAGIISPLATLVLVLLTLFGALPMYRRVAELSPHGQGSISLLEELLPRWRGKALVLCLLGFAATGFIITITLSAADATAHIIENPLTPEFFNHPILLTLILLSALGAIFLKGFREAVGLAIPIVAVYLLLNVIVVGWGLQHLWQHPEALPAWRALALAEHGSWTHMIGVALVLFPHLALGLSGFETGVAVMPLVQGDPGDDPRHPEGRIRNARKLLTTAALIMSVMLVGSSIVTTTADSAGGIPGGRRSVRPRARVSRARASRPYVRHDLRPQHGGHPVVRRRVGARRAAQPRAAVPAALRDGAGVGQGEPSARADLHGDYLRRDDPVRGGRQRAGRRLRDRRARADGIGLARRDDLGLAWRDTVVRLLRC